MNLVAWISQPAKPAALIARPPWNWLCQATGGASLGGLRPDTDALTRVPVEELGVSPSATCKGAEDASGGR